MFPTVALDEIVKVQAHKEHGVTRGYVVYLNGVRYPRIKGGWYFGADYECVEHALRDRYEEKLLPMARGF